MWVGMKRPIVVQKYGGSSVADIQRLKEVADRVAQTVQQGCRVVVVISAMGRTTDELLRLATSIDETPPRRELDMLLSAGERMASALLAMSLEKMGCPAISFTGSQCGIITTHRHTEARIIEVRPYRVQDELDAGRVVIIAGYQGVSYKKEVTTLGRGGSDTTAVAMAAALGADYCEICSDVDGVYSADPAVVPEAQHLPSVSYEHMQELSNWGARVLNAEAVEFARVNQITLIARATGGSDKSTTIGGPDPDRPIGVTSIAPVSRIVLSPPDAASLATLLAQLEREGRRPLWTKWSSQEVELAIPADLKRHATAEDSQLVDPQLIDGQSADGQFGAGAIDRLDELSLVSVVGADMNAPGALARALGAIDASGGVCVTLDATPRRLSILCSGDGTAAQRHLHEAFV